MPGLNVSLMLPDGTVKEGTVIPDDNTTDQIISDAVDSSNLPRLQQDGRTPVTYSLQVVNRLITLDKGQTLRSAGVRDGDIIKLACDRDQQPISKTAAAVPGEQPDLGPLPVQHRSLLWQFRFVLIGGGIILVIVSLLLLISWNLASRQETALETGRPAYKATPPPHTKTDIERYPTMECPEIVSSDTEFALQITLTEALITPEVKIESGKTTDEKQLALVLPNDPNNRTWKIDVVVSAPDFNLRDGKNASEIVLPQKGDSTPAVFYLRPKPFSGVKRSGKIYGTLWHRGNYLAKIVREVSVVAASTRSRKGAGVSQQDQQSRGELADIKASVDQSVHFVDLNVNSPDLTLFVLENKTNPAESQIIINSPYLQPAVHQFFSPQDLTHRLEAMYQRFARLGARGPVIRDSAEAVTADNAQDLMRGFGRLLYAKYAPPAFKDAFWQLADRLGSDFDTIQIYSNNPVLPWELMCPTRLGRTTERTFLGLEFNIGRWHISEETYQLERPPQSILLRELIVIAPEYSGDQTLPAQAIEIRALESIKGYQRLPGRIQDLRILFQDFPQGIIHFAGHGMIKTSPERIPEYYIALEDGALDVMTWRGMINRQNQNHPLFFLNACDVGQSQRVANTVDGWAPAVLEAGASGYIGALWPLGDKSASDFAGLFYQILDAQLKTGPVRIAAVLKEVRRRGLENHDPTFLAYVYYGDPNLVFVGAQ